MVCRQGINMSLSDQDEGVKKRAVDNIMKLINSQLALEKKQAKMDAKVRACARHRCKPIEMCSVQPRWTRAGSGQGQRSQENG